MSQTQVASLVNSLVDTVWNLLQFHQFSIRRCDEMGTRWNRAADDNKNLRVIGCGSIVCVLQMLLLLAARTALTLPDVYDK